MVSMEQLARNILERCGYLDAQGLAASDVVELANILNLLAESKREHDNGDVDVAYRRACPKAGWKDETCTCGADAWNARVDVVLGQSP